MAMDDDRRRSQKPSPTKLNRHDARSFCARMAVARGDAVYNSPIFETEVKGGAYSVTLHLHRRAIAGAIARSRLHFLRDLWDAATVASDDIADDICADANVTVACPDYETDVRADRVEKFELGFPGCAWDTNEAKCVDNDNRGD